MQSSYNHTMASVSDEAEAQVDYMNREMSYNDWWEDIFQRECTKGSGRERTKRKRRGVRLPVWSFAMIGVLLLSAIVFPLVYLVDWDGTEAAPPTYPYEPENLTNRIILVDSAENKNINLIIAEYLATL